MLLVPLLKAAVAAQFADDTRSLCRCSSRYKDKETDAAAYDDGAECCRLLRSLSPSLPALMVASSSPSLLLILHSPLRQGAVLPRTPLHVTAVSGTCRKVQRYPCHLGAKAQSESLQIESK